jgi:hypothetical protein
MMMRSTVVSRPTRHLRVLRPVALVLYLVAALLVGSATPAAALTKPVVNGPVFNDPLGTSAQQSAIFTQLIRLIDATPAGAQIRCWIDVIYAESDSTITGKLDKAGIQHRRCRISNGPGIDVRPHNKEMLIDGSYGGDITPRVYAGSANLTGSSLRSADEAVLRIASASYHAKYLSTFYKIRSACGG